MAGLPQSQSAKLLNVPDGTINAWRKRLGLPTSVSLSQAQKQKWRASIYAWRSCITCHAAIRMLPAESGRMIGWNDRGAKVANVRKRLGLWVPTAFDRARIPVVKTGRAKRHQWGRKARIPNVSKQASSTKWLQYVYCKEARALEKLESQVCWSNHPLAFSKMDTKKWYRVQTNTVYERAREAAKLRYNNDENYRMRCIIRGVTSRIKRKLPLDWNSEQILGATIETVCAHIEAQFSNGMSWANQGKWHVDHIMPLCKFDLTDPMQARIAGNYKNLRPLWGHLNLKKSGRWTGESQQVWELLRLEQGIFSN